MKAFASDLIGHVNTIWCSKIFSLAYLGGQMEPEYLLQMFKFPTFSCHKNVITIKYEKIYQGYHIY